MTIFAVYANEIFWGTFVGNSKEDAIQAAANEHGTIDIGQTQASTNGMEARTMNEVICTIREYADQPIEELVTEWNNHSEVYVDEDGNIWIANPSKGHWLNDEDKAKFVEWCESR